MEPPFIDEHQVLVNASPAAVWQSIAAQLTGGRLAAAEAYGALVGAQPRRAGGVPMTEGATLPGFAVTAVQPERRLELTGSHRFSRYRLVATLTPESAGTRLTARTDAEFPGFLGGVYRLLVISSRAHHLMVGRLLRTIARRAER